jgi:hypothetical protein
LFARALKEVPAGLRCQWQVQYLHRTVRDYFAQPKIWLVLSKWAPGFDPYLSLCQAFILEIKHLQSGAASTSTPQECMNIALMLASMANVGSRPTLIIWLDAANSITASLMKRGELALTPLDFSLPTHHAPLFPLAIEFDLDFYVEHLLSNGHPATSRKHFNAYISFAIEKQFPKAWTSNGVQCLQNIRFEYGGIHDVRYPVSSKSLGLLLRYGATFHDRRGDEPYLKHLRLEFAEALFRVLSGTTPNETLMEHWLAALEALASFGADLSSFWDVLPERKVKELDRTAPHLGTRLREMLKVEQEGQQPDNRNDWGDSPRIRALKKRKRRREAGGTDAKGVRGH